MTRIKFISFFQRHSWVVHTQFCVRKTDIMSWSHWVAVIVSSIPVIRKSKISSAFCVLLLFPMVLCILKHIERLTTIMLNSTFFFAADSIICHQNRFPKGSLDMLNKNNYWFKLSRVASSQISLPTFQHLMFHSRSVVSLQTVKCTWFLPARLLQCTG